MWFWKPWDPIKIIPMQVLCSLSRPYYICMSVSGFYTWEMRHVCDSYTKYFLLPLVDKVDVVKTRLFARGFLSGFGFDLDRVSWVSHFFSWFEYGMAYICLALDSFGVWFPVWTLHARPFFSFRSIELSLVRCQSQVTREPSLLAVYLEPILDCPSPCGTLSLVTEVVLAALGWKP